MAITERCPICGGEITENSRAYGCGNWRDKDGGCKFVIWKEFNGHTFTEDEVVSLIKREKIGPVECVSRKTGNPYQALLQYNTKTMRLDMTFPERKKEETTEKIEAKAETEAEADKFNSFIPISDDEDELPFN